MLDSLKKLADKLDGEIKSELLAEVANLENGLMPKPKTLDDILNSEEYADLRPLFNKREGQLRTKWESETKTPETKTPEPTDADDFKKFISEQIGGLKTELETLRGEKTKETLKTYAAEKMKSLPAKFQTLIHVGKESTQESIDEQIASATEAYNEILKDIDQSPKVGYSTEITDDDYNEFLEQKKTEITN